MSEPVGRARLVMVAAVVAAVILMLLAIAVVIFTASRPLTTRPTPHGTSTPRQTGAAPSMIEPSPAPVARPLIVPAAIADRPLLPFCGHETVNRLPEGDFYDADVWKCFLEARDAGEAAELIRDSLTPEAGHLRDIFRLVPGGDIEWYADTTQDALGGRRWTRVVCGDLEEAARDPAGTAIYFPADCGAAEVIIEADAPDTPTGDEMAMLEELILFARSPDAGLLDAIPLADDGVWLGLANRLISLRSPEELADPAAWTIANLGFRERVGPFSALDVLAEWNPMDAFEVREAVARVGDYPFCFEGRQPRPPEMGDARRLSLQPVFTGPAPCLTFWTVDLFLGPDASIKAITIDFGTP